MVVSAIKRVGGKSKLANWIVSHLPAHKVYVEPFGGSLAVGLALPDADTEYRKVFNDLDKNVWNLFRVLRDEHDSLIRKVALTPYSQHEFCRAYEIINGTDRVYQEDAVEWARLYLILNRQSMFGKEKKTWSIARKGENIARTWARLSERLEVVASRLRGCFVACEHYEALMRRWDSPETTHYCDPPYEGVEKDYYAVNKKSGFDHRAFAGFASTLKGNVVVSYYKSDFITALYPGFEVFEKEVTKHMQIGTSKEKAFEILLVKKAESSQATTEAVAQSHFNRIVPSIANVSDN